MAGSYVVESAEGVFVCDARRNVKAKTGNILVGDVVGFSVEKSGKGVIERVEKRRNALKRPPVSNVDLALLLLSKEPIPDFSLIDKMLVSLSVLDIPAIILITKSDLGQNELFERAKENYNGQTEEIILFSSRDERDVFELKKKLAGKLTCVIGQSAVGKSTLINALQSERTFETGGLSKIKRGRNTTRHSEIVFVDKGTYIVDTPGFSLFDLDMEPEELKKHYFDFNEYSGDCRYRDCNHINEPDCAVKAAIEEGKLLKERYGRYLEIYKELEEKRRKKYG